MIASSVSTTEPGVPKDCARKARTTPLFVVVAKQAPAHCVRRSPPSARHPKDAAVIEVHRKRADERNKQIDRHRHRDDRHRRARLVEHRPGEDLDEVGIANENRQRQFLNRLRYWLVSGGMISRSACGTTTNLRVCTASGRVYWQLRPALSLIRQCPPERSRR